MEEQQQERNILVPVANGCEEIETVSIIDILRRAGAIVTVASVMGKDKDLILMGSRGIKLIADCHYEECIDKEYDLIALPGGLENAQLLSDCQSLVEQLKKQKQMDKYYAAICASPAYVFEKHGLLDGEIGTCHPSCEQIIKNKSRLTERVIVSNKCITSRGPGTALEFAYMLVEKMFTPEKALQLAKSMVHKL